MINRIQISGILAGTVALLFFILSLYIASFHEIWVDEAHHWLLAKESGSVSELVFNARYEGHPILWNLILFAITRFTGDIFWMQCINVFFAAASVFILFRYAPFNIVHKILLASGYFFIYEYAVISRNYSLSVFFLFCACSLYSVREERKLPWFLCLAFLANTHLFGLILAIGFVFVDTKSFLSDKKWLRYVAFFFVPAIIISLLQIITPSDHLFHWNFSDLLNPTRIAKAISAVWRGVVPLQDMSTYYSWNSNLLLTVSKTITVVTSIFLLTFFLFLLKADRKVQLFFVFGAGGILLFIFLSPLILAVRHSGYIFLTLIVSIWLAQLNSAYLKHRYYPLQKYFVLCLLVVQSVSGLKAIADEIDKPFSAAKDCAAFIRKKYPDTTQVILSNHGAGPSVAAYLNRDLYYPEKKDFGSFCNWNVNPFLISDEELEKRILVFVAKNKEQAILVMNHRVNFKKLNIKPVTLFTNSLVKNERYWIYEILD